MDDERRFTRIMTTAGKDNLTRVEAQERARLIGDVSYDIKLNLREGAITFTSETTVRFACRDTSAKTFIDLDAVELQEVVLNGRVLDIKETKDGRIQLDSLDETNELVVVATCEYAKTGTGLHRTVDPVDKNAYTYTQFEPFDAHRVFACFDQPDLKATFTWSVEVPEEWVVVSNTRPTSRPDEGKAGLWSFPVTPTMSTYLACICAGPYVGVFDKHGDIELGWWARKSLAKYVDPDELFDLTKAGFDFYTDLFDYPYMTKSYDQVFCPEYKFGAMENLGCVTYSERMIYRSKATEAEREARAEVILHEMAHMWFGDLVTMRWWNDLWLNESFATYISYLAKERATRFTNSWVSFASGEKNWAYRQDQLPTTHPIVAEIPDIDAVHLNFDGITYAKGASVLKQLVAWVGEKSFFEGLRRYFKTHEWSNTELGDFLAPLADESGRDLIAWSKEWLETSGVDSIRMDGTTVVQEGDLLRSHRMAIGLFDASGSSLDLRREIELDVVGARTAVPELEDEAPADLVLPNHKDLAYCKIRFDAKSLDTLTSHLRDLGDPLARTLCWNALWDMVRDGELAAGRYVDIVLNNVGAETDIGVVGDLAGRVSTLGAFIGLLNQAIDVYGDPSRREAAWKKVAARLRELISASEPGSDFQLAWTRALVIASRSGDELGFVRGLLDGTTSIDGIEVDTDLRWQITSALAAFGAIDEKAIQAELERDPTDEGERWAANARASLPDAGTKAEEWEHMTQSSEVSLATLRTVALGFNRPFQAELLAPFTEKYFAELLPFWEKRELDLGLAFAGGFYPRAYSKDVIAATDELLGGDLPFPIRRILLENKDEAERVLRTRAADK
jgi:aminopeptidase N